MKKTNFIILFISVFILLHSLSRPSFGALESFDVIPEDSVAFITVDYTKLNLLEKIAKSLGADVKTLAALDELDKYLGFSATDPDFLGTITRVTAVIWESQPDPYLGIIIELKSPGRFNDYLEKFKKHALSRSGGKIKFYLREGKPFPVNVIEDTISKETVAYIMKDNFCLLAPGGLETGLLALESMVKTCDGKINSIKKSNSFKRLTGKVPTAKTAFGYIDGRWIEELARREKPLEQPLDFIESLGMSVDFSGEQFRLKGALFFNSQAKSNKLLEIFSSPFPENKIALSLPTDTLILLYFRFVFTPDIVKDPALNEAKATLNASLGIDFDMDLMPWLGEQYFISMSDFKLKDGKPAGVPGFYLGIATKDRTKTVECLEKIEASFKLKGIESKKVEFAGSDISYFILPAAPLPDLVLAYSVTPDFLVLGTSVENMKKFLGGTGGSTARLDATAGFMKTMTGARNSILGMYLAMERLSDILVELAKIGGSPLKKDEIDIIKSLSAIGLVVTGSKECLEFNIDCAPSVSSGQAGAVSAQRNSSDEKDTSVIEVEIPERGTKNPAESSRTGN